MGFPSTKRFDEAIDQRVAALASGLYTAGLPREHCRVLAFGYMRCLWQLVWETHSELLGSSDELEAKLQWVGSPRTLCGCLCRAGLIVQKNGHWMDVLAFQEAPQYVRKRWQRKTPVTYTLASERAKRMVAGPVEIEESLSPPSPEPVNLFGEPDVTTNTNRKAASSHGSTDAATYTPGHKELVAFWVGKWGEKYGSKYPFRPVDAKHIRTILDTCTGFEHAQGTLLSYLSDDDRFLKGHSLNRLIGNLPKYTTAQHVGRRAGEYAEPERNYEPVNPDAILGRGDATD